MDHIARRVSLSFFLFLVFAAAARGQSASLYYAGGSATDSSTGPLNTLGAGVTFNTPTLGGFFETVGGDIVRHNRIGVGAEFSFRSDRGPYAGLEYRPSFYDVNAVYYPLLNTRRIAPEIQGGFGRSRLTFFYTPQFCIVAPQGCSSVNGKVTTVNDLQLHFSGGVRIFVWKNVFVRPQLDIRWVHNLDYFGSSIVPEYTVAVGYEFRSLRVKKKR